MPAEHLTTAGARQFSGAHEKSLRAVRTARRLQDLRVQALIIT
jgi:hypothetical protein